MRFRFCGDLDCPDWIIVEVSALSKMPASIISAITSQIISSFEEGNFNYDQVADVLSKGSHSISDLKGAISAIHFIITSAAKYDIDDISLLQEIQQLGLHKEHSDIIAMAFKEKKNVLRSQLAEDSYRISKLLSTQWRVDHIIESSEGSTASNVAHFKLVVDTKPQQGKILLQDGKITSPITDPSRIDNVFFDISAEKLDAMIYELSKAEQLLNELNK
eukprot:gene7487-15327_t